jgi:putative endonuclease
VTERTRLWRFGEQCAADWYENAGFTVLARNWRGAAGELDLVVGNEAVVVFVEVKARSSSRFGTGAEAVDWRKQRRVRAVASEWLGQREPGDARFVADLRFDVVDVDGRGTLQVHEGCF